MSGSAFAKLLDKHCLEGHNFLTWYPNLKIFMTIEKIMYVLEKAPDIEPPSEDASQEVRAEYDKHVDDDCQAMCHILASMNEELQKSNEHMMHAADIISHLQELYREGTCNRRFSALESLNSPLDRNLTTNIFLASLSDSFSQFVVNYNMGKMENTLSELQNMCVIAEKTFKIQGGNETIVVFEKSTSSANPGNKGKGKFNASKKKK
ncbi:uncharacterized protein LOC18775400 [Prunus persica]|uniref:uncharacterized protein LOC18775400 n=1 Tax=Prunus persica TaxID=3760 RepID=UPI0009AB8F43|nr:uncharacterized protein LOC18775400 [Prunus persica]